MSKLLNMETRHKLEVAGCEKRNMVVEEKQPKNQITLNPIRRLFGRFENPQEHIRPYVASGQVVADIGCGSGYIHSLWLNALVLKAECTQLI